MGLGRRRRWISPVLAGNTLGLAKPLWSGLISHGLILFTEHKMKRITVPEPEIELYEDGFEGHDMLGRAETGKKLSELVERIDEPLVIALDGAWGSGKSFFLKCWVGEHLKEEKHKAETVYFDAFKHDYLDEPLIGLTQAIADRLPADSRGRKFIQSSKKVVSKLGMPALRIAGAAATGGATEVTGAVLDGVIKSGWKEAEKAAQDFWNTHTAKAAAMEQFRSALEQLTKPNEDKEPQQKLVIVVDELDRCRPDYALSLLEIIKHFFNVPGVHFVLGVNLMELQNSVKARYGAGVDSERYLQKFITLNMKLGCFKNLIIDDETPTIGKYFEHCAQLMGLEHSPFYDPVKSYIFNMQWESDFSLRALHRMLSALRLASLPSNQLGDSTKDYNIALVSGLLILAAFDPKAIASVRNETGEMYEIVSALNLEDPRDASGQELTNWIAWAACFNHPELSYFVTSDEKANHLCLVFGLDRVHHLLESCIDIFELTDGE